MTVRVKKGIPMRSDPPSFDKVLKAMLDTPPKKKARKADRRQQADGMNQPRRRKKRRR